MALVVIVCLSWFLAVYIYILIVFLYIRCYRENARYVLGIIILLSSV